MVWDDLTYDSQAADPLGRPRDATPIAFDASLHQFYRDAIALRQSLPALRRGSWEPVENDDAAKFFAFRRELEGKEVLVAFNRGDKPFVWNMPEKSAPSAQIVLATDEAATLAPFADGERRQAVLPAFSGVVIATR
jgi:glycosidase